MEARRAWLSSEKVVRLTRITDTIASAANALKHDDYFSRRFNQICGHTNPQTWTTKDAWRILQTYRHIIFYLRQHPSEHTQHFDVRACIKDAMWLYANTPEHSHQNHVGYHLAAAQICLDSDTQLVYQLSANVSRQPAIVTTLANHAAQAMPILEKVATLLAQREHDREQTNRWEEQLIRCYANISVIHGISTDYDQALAYAQRAMIATTSLQHLQAHHISFLFQMLTKLADAFSFHGTYRATFSFVSQFLRGEESASLLTLKQLDFSCRQQFSPDSAFNQFWVHCLLLMDALKDSPLIPDRGMKLTGLNSVLNKHHLVELEPDCISYSPPLPLPAREKLFGEAQPKKLAFDDSTETSLFIPDQDFSSFEFAYSDAEEDLGNECHSPRPGGG